MQLDRVLDVAEQTGARAVLISTISTHAEVHKQNMRHLHELAQQHGLRERLVLIAGGTQVTDELARVWYGRGIRPRDDGPRRGQLLGPNDAGKRGRVAR